MALRGAKPRELGHIQQLDASSHAKTRMETLLLTLSGRCTIAEAQQRLQLSESQVHSLRHAWLQQSVALLEPRRRGRPPREPTADPQQLADLERENEALRRELALARASCEVQQTLGVPAVKKGAPSS